MTEMPKISEAEQKVVKALQAIVGEKNATAAKHVRYAYSYDMSFVLPKLPDYVVMAENVEQVQGIMRFANQEKIPVVPFTAGTNIGGLCIPERGGILLDLKRMNKIVKIDPESHYAVVEPGVSHGMLAEALFEHRDHFLSARSRGFLKQDPLTELGGLTAGARRQGATRAIRTHQFVGQRVAPTFGFRVGVGCERNRQPEQPKQNAYPQPARSRCVAGEPCARPLAGWLHHERPNLPKAVGEGGSAPAHLGSPHLGSPHLGSPHCAAER